MNFSCYLTDVIVHFRKKKEKAKTVFKLLETDESHPGSNVNIVVNIIPVFLFILKKSRKRSKNEFRYCFGIYSSRLRLVLHYFVINIRFDYKK